MLPESSLTINDNEESLAYTRTFLLCYAEPRLG